MLLKIKSSEWVFFSKILLRLRNFDQNLKSLAKTLAFTVPFSHLQAVYGIYFVTILAKTDRVKMGSRQTNSHSENNVVNLRPIHYTVLYSPACDLDSDFR